MTTNYPGTFFLSCRGYSKPSTKNSQQILISLLRMSSQGVLSKKPR